MALEKQKLLFFSAIFVVFVAVGVTVGKVVISPTSQSGAMSPAQLWKAIEQGKISNASSLVVEGVIKSIKSICTLPLDLKYYQIYLVYFKGCDVPFFWGVFDHSPISYLLKKVEVLVWVRYLGHFLPSDYGKEGWVAIITEILAPKPVEMPKLGDIYIEETSMEAGDTYTFNIIAYDTENRPLQGVEISLRGCGVNVTKVTDASGKATFTITPQLPSNVHTGIIEVTAKYGGTKLTRSIVVERD